MDNTARHHANIRQTRQDLGRILVDARVGQQFDPQVFCRELGADRARKFETYLTRTGRDAGTVLLEISQDARRLEDLAVALAPVPSRQSAGAKRCLEELQTRLSATFFPSPVLRLPRQGDDVFVACPDVARSAEFFGLAGDVAYLFWHKCSNLSGGSQFMSHSELERIALAATFPAGRYDGFVLRSPERVLSRITHAFGVSRAVLVLLQDGRGREEDMDRLRAIAAPEHQLPTLGVCADTTENFLLLQPLVHARVVGGPDNLSSGQRSTWEDACQAFRLRFPEGHNGYRVP